MDMDIERSGKWKTTQGSSHAQMTAVCKHTKHTKTGKTAPNEENKEMPYLPSSHLPQVKLPSCVTPSKSNTPRSWEQGSTVLLANTMTSKCEWLHKSAQRISLQDTSTHLLSRLVRCLTFLWTK